MPADLRLRRCPPAPPASAIGGGPAETHQSCLARAHHGVTTGQQSPQLGKAAAASQKHGRTAVAAGSAGWAGVGGACGSPGLGAMLNRPDQGQGLKPPSLLLVAAT